MTKYQHYFQRGFADGSLGRPATRMSEPAYASGYRAGKAGQGKSAPVKIVQIDFNGWDEYEVRCILADENSQPEHDSMHTARAKAERRAEVIAKIYGCEWETNYR